MHPYQSLTRNRDRSMAQRPTAGFNPAPWIVSIGFIIIIGCVLYPLFAALAGTGL
jgi:hypothetical protein